MNKIILSLTLIFLNNSCFSMETQKPKSDCSLKMTHITQWSDVTQFAGYIIAYKTKNNSGKEYPIKNSDPLLKFGYTYPRFCENWEGGQKGYEIVRLLKKAEVSGVYSLRNSDIDEISPLLMRLATNDELQSIRHAIFHSKEAKFAYGDEEEIESLLKVTERKNKEKS